MQDVLLKLNEAHEEIQKVDTQARERLADVLSRETRLFKREKDADEKDAILTDREVVCSKIENIIAYKEEALKLMSDASALMEKATTAQKELDNNVKIETAKLNDLRDVTRREQENVDKQKAGVESEVSKRVEQCLINMGIKKA